MDLSFSFIIPVYNRPLEVKELLQSLTEQNYNEPFEVVVIEDGSIETSENSIEPFKEKLDIAYFKKTNTGPGDSRNYGMKRAKGNYFIILDSDCILPPNYLSIIAKALRQNYVECYGGPDTAHHSFTIKQKAINYAMTSFFTTGGIRGKSNAIGRFQPRSFNMGISKYAFELTDGFGNIHPGEDPDLTFRLWDKGIKTELINTAYVFHNRRIDWGKFYTQVKKFGQVRPILNKWHPTTQSQVYWFPTIFSMGLMFALVMLIKGIFWPCLVFLTYFVLIFIDASLKSKKLGVAFMAILAVLIQFFGYGFGFLKSTILLTFSKKSHQELFPDLFFKN